MNEKMQTELSAGGEFGFLDLLVTLAENLKLLIFGSLLVGLCALGISFVIPPTYQSVAVLQAEQATASLMTTAAVLDPVIASLGLAKDGTLDEARTKLRQQIKAAVGRNDKLLTLTVSDRTAQQAQATANAVLKQTYQESRPKGSARKRLEVQLAEAQARLNNAQDASVGVLKRLESSGSGVGGGVELARGYAELLTATGAAQGQISALEAQLEGLSAAQLVQAPTLPQKASQPKKGLIAVGATLATGLALLLFVFMRQALRSNVENASVAGKWARIRQSLGLK
jgi:capsular polysaccharide biosynthesis protein